MRIFLAINLPPPFRREILDATTSLRHAAPSLSWVGDDRLHLTLKFLGETEETRVPEISAALDTVARKHHPFRMQVAEIGAFPNFRRARVVWMGVERDPKLELLHHDVEVAFDALGFEIEGRPFRPHLTLARVRDRTAPDELRQLSRASKKVQFEGESDVHSVDLMKSNLGTAEQRYERLHAARLRAE